ncbi:acyl-CoA dehydrogenase family protein [Mycobacterium sp. C31M]
MSLVLTDVQHELVQMVRKFVRTEVVPLEHELDPDASRIDPAIRDRLRDRVRQMGLYNLEMDEAHGGPGLDYVTRSLIAIETSQHRAGLYTPCYEAFGPMPLAALTDGTEDQKDRYLWPTLRGERMGCFALTEPSGGSDPRRAIKTWARRDGDDWIINGSKMWISLGADADYAMVFARTAAEGDVPDGITCFIVDTDTPGFEVRRVIPTIRTGHEATELQFDDVRVPDANVLGQVGRGFALANKKLTANRIPYSAGCIGVAVRAQELAIEYSKMRSVFGKTLAEHQGIEWMLVDNETDIRTATLLVLEAAARADHGLPFRTHAAMAKIAATEAAARVVDRSMQIHGGMGMAKEMPLERWYRELRIRRVGEGPNEVQKMIIGRELLGRPYEFFLTAMS